MVPVLALTQKREALFWYYFDLLYPAQFLVIGIVVDQILRITARQRPSPLLQGSANAAVVVTVGVIALSHAACVGFLHRDVITSGALSLPTAINLRFPEPIWMIKEPGSIELMALRYKRDLTAAVLADAPMNEASFLGRVHGAAFDDLIEDKGYFFQLLSRPVAATPHESHYAIVRGRDWPGSDQGSIKRIGPFLLYKYQPAVQYDSWQYTKEPGLQWFMLDGGGPSWAPVHLPSRLLPDRSRYVETPLFYWGTSRTYYRGWLNVQEGVDNLYLVVSLRDSPAEEHRHRVTAMYLNAQPLEPRRIHMYRTILARSTEVVFETGRLLKPGQNLVAFEVSGTFPVFNLDVYEARLEGGTLP
jgi:hypothetical protein